MTIEATGLDHLRRALREIKDRDLDTELKAIHKDLAEDVLKEALPNVRVRTGRLKQSVRAAGTLKDAIGRAGSKSVPYAAAVHWGIGPPFLTDAAAHVEQGVTDRYDDRVARMLDRKLGG